MTTAKFIYFNLIKITSDDWIDPNAYFAFISNGNEEYLWNKKFYQENDKYIGEFYLEHNVFLGDEYLFRINEFTTIISVKELPLRSDFDTFFYYDGELGAIVNGNKTTFRVWTPLATEVNLLLEDEVIKMERIDCGVYQVEIDRNCHLEKYLYQAKIDGEWVTSIDPYGKSSTLNSKESVVIDFSKIKIDLNNDKVSEKIPSGQSLIYELHLRDFSMINDGSVDKSLQNKFKFLTKEDLYNKAGHPIGLNYLKYLGVSHVQLLPVLDFGSVDETNPFAKYNWGYDPVQFFTLEGSYASELENPLSRVVDFKEMVAALHKNGIRVILDVVYNHVYEHKSTSFHKLVPNYFFRREGDMMTNCSGCGNDFATEKKMARKIIVDSLKFLSSEYGVDGYRFDLMGLMDTDTLNLASDELHKIKPETYLYGEGWNMYRKDGYRFGNIGNCDILPTYSFFNDKFRDIVKGDTFNRFDKGYAFGNAQLRDGMRFLLYGSCNNIVYRKMFIDSTQSLNYVECHDNMTLFDKIKLNYERVTNDFLMKKVALINSIVLICPGISFIHMGQEFGQSKGYRDNTYKDNDGINYFNNDLYNKNFLYTRTVSEFRKIVQELPYLRKSDPDTLRDIIAAQGIGQCGLSISINTDGFNSKYNNLKIIINPSDEETIFLDFDKEQKVLFSSLGRYMDSHDLETKNLMVAPNTLLILCTK